MLFMVSLALMAMISVTHGKTLIFSDTIPPHTIDWEDTLTLSKFPPGLGALSAINIAIGASIDGSLLIENLHDTSTTISSTTDVNVKLTRPDGSMLAASIATQTNADTFPIFDGTPDLKGISSKTYPLSAQKQESITLSNLSEADIALFTGTDTITLPVMAKGTTGFVSVGHVLTEFNIAASATISVTYTYNEPDLTVQFIPQNPLRIGGEFTYIILVKNIGSDAAMGPITVSDILPPTFLLTDIRGADWACSYQNQTNTCTHAGPLPSGMSLPVLTVSVHIGTSSPPTLSKTLSVSLRGDINSNNNILTTGLLIAGTGQERYEPPNYHFPQPEEKNTQKEAGNASHEPSLSSSQQPFSFGQEHGAFGGPTKPATGATLIIDAEGCPVSQEYLIPHAPIPLCSQWDEKELPLEPFSRKDIINAALRTQCIPIQGDTIKTAQIHSIITGDPRPDDLATNAEALVILLRASNALPRGYALQTPLNWIAPYLHFARAHHLVSPTFDPHGSPTRNELLNLIKNTQFLNPDPRVNRQTFSPIRLVEDLTPNEGTTCTDRDPHIISCLTKDPWRELEFSDITPSDAAFRAIDLLRTTRIAPKGDYIFSGHGNHSSGVQQEQFQKGTFEFQPLRPATRLEVVKIALISNCIPILDYLPRGTPTFKDIDKQFLHDDLHDFTARVFYTAALHGIIKGYPDGTARPYDQADHLEAMAILLRAAGAVPRDYQPHPPDLTGLSSNGWYAPYTSFASQYNFLPLSPLTQPILRSTLSQLLTKTMEYSEDIRVRAYLSSIHPLLQ